MTERKASDILLSVDDKLSELLEIAKSIDNNVKLILKSSNDKPKPKIVETIVADKPKPIVSTGKAVTVQQKILYSEDQRPAILAEIKIFDSSTMAQVATTKTNPGGLWTKQLMPGNYLIEIKKGPTATKQGFVKKFEESITDNGKGSIELENRLV